MAAPGAPDKWLVTLTEVEELKCVVRLIPIMLTLVIYNAIYVQVGGGGGLLLFGAWRAWAGVPAARVGRGAGCTGAGAG